MWEPENWPKIARELSDEVREIMRDSCFRGLDDEPERPPIETAIEYGIRFGAKAMHKADVEWLKAKSKEAFEAYNEGKLQSSYTMLVIPQEEWERFIEK